MAVIQSTPLRFRIARAQELRSPPSAVWSSAATARSCSFPPAAYPIQGLATAAVKRHSHAVRYLDGAPKNLHRARVGWEKQFDRKFR
jgi:hypothetical protein